MYLKLSHGIDRSILLEKLSLGSTLMYAKLSHFVGKISLRLKTETLSQYMHPLI